MIEKLELQDIYGFKNWPAGARDEKEAIGALAAKLNEIIDVVNRMNGEDYIEGPIVSALAETAKLAVQRNDFEPGLVRTKHGDGEIAPLLRPPSK